jgi:phosphoenolpyruvate carboxylase
MSGHIKMTVQGETIANQFANRLTATYNMEMFVAGTARQAMISSSKAKDESLYNMMDQLVDMARKTYRRLLDHPEFIDFYSNATPIDVLEQSKIGSRPARRTGQRSLDDLRSIPWVFSWSQSRFNISGWFGMGTALEEFLNEHLDGFERLKELAIEWPFLKYLLIQVESNLLNSDREIMNDFSELVPSESAKKELMELILTDYKKGLDKIEEIMKNPIETRRVSKLANIQLRNNALKVLHEIQVDYLKKWRSIRHKDAEQSDQYLLQLLLVVNALSGGLKSTG